MMPSRRRADLVRSVPHRVLYRITVG